MSSSAESDHPESPHDVRAQPGLTAQIDGFAREAIDEEATRLGVPVEELVTFFSVLLYYLADMDSRGRIARLQITTQPLLARRSLSACPRAAG